MSKVFKAKFPGECICCGGTIHRGQRIYHDGGGYRHTDCEAIQRMIDLAAEMHRTNTIITEMAGSPARVPLRRSPNPLCDPVLGAEEWLFRFSDSSW